MTLSGRRNFGNLRADHAAGFGVLVEDHDLIAERGEVAGDGERGGSAADEGNALAVLLRRRLGQPLRDVVLVVGGDALQAADRHRLVFHAHAPAGRLAGTVAGAPEHAGKHVRMPVDHVGVGVTPGRRSAGYIRAPACAPGRPTGNRRLYESSPGRRYRYSSFIPRNAPGYAEQFPCRVAALDGCIAPRPSAAPPGGESEPE